MKTVNSKLISERNIQMFLIGWMLILLTSCTKDWLDKKPEVSAVIPEILKDCQALLDNNSFFNAGAPGYSETASDGHYINSTSIPSLTSNARNAYTWSNEPAYQNILDWAQPTSNTGVAGGSYGKIYVCNLILETIDKIDRNPINQIEYDNIKGQALFQRGKAFFELAQVFSPPYYQGMEDNAFGLPLRLETDVNNPSIRATSKETYDRIISDLKESENLLPAKALYLTRASKTATLAMLARVFLSIEDYGNAFRYSNDALNLYSTLMDYSELIPTQSFPIPLLNKEIIYHSDLATYTPNTTNARIDLDLKALYHTDDLRNSIFFTVSAGQVTFKGYYRGGRACFNGLATDELYLIRAESNARLGRVAEAMLDLNTLLKNRWRKVGGVSTYVNQVTTNADLALDIILKERKKELLLRGLRWSDLRRLNRDPRFATTITRIVNGITYTLEPNSYKYTFPIPLEVIQMTGIAQNPGW